MILGGPRCRLQTCSRLTSKWFNSTFPAFFLQFILNFEMLLSLIASRSELQVDSKYISADYVWGLSTTLLLKQMFLVKFIENFYCFNIDLQRHMYHQNQHSILRWKKIETLNFIMPILKKKGSNVWMCFPSWCLYLNVYR